MRNKLSFKIQDIIAGPKSMVSSLVDLQEGQLIPKYLYVSNSNKHVNKKDEETDDYMALLQWFLMLDDRTRSKFAIDCCWAYV